MRLADKALACLSPACFASVASGGDWIAARHLLHIDKAITDLVFGHGKGERVLIVEAPPRHGKSELVSKWLPAWYLGIRPEARVLLGSYSDKFARRWGARTRDVMRVHGPEFFGVRPRRGAGATEWDIVDHDGGMVCAGIGGSFTGRGANLLIVDDPIKNAEEAISPIVRDTQWDWWQSTAWPRLEPDAVAIVMATRWHQDDLIGRLVKWSAEEHVPIRRVRLPALAEEGDELGRQPGEALWPERIPLAELAVRRSMLDAYWWASLYQQQPGDFGRAEWPESYFPPELFTTRANWPEAFNHAAIAVDPSKGRTKNSDYCGIVFVGVARGKLWIAARLGRWATTPMVENILDHWQTFGGDRVGIESNAWQDLLAPEIARVVASRGGVPMPVSLIDNTVNKLLRIGRLGPYLHQGQVRVLDDEGGRLLVQQLKDFPNGSHDDGPDACEMAVRLIGHLKRARA